MERRGNPYDNAKAESFMNPNPYYPTYGRLASKALVHTVVLARVTQASLYQIRVVEACARRIGIHDADLDHDHFSAFHFARVARPYFTGSSLILSPPFATGMTQMGVATSAELSSDI
jgi:hypothetical protein